MEAKVKKQEFSLAHLTVMDLPPPQMIYVASRAGYDYVSLRPIYMGLPGEPNYALADTGMRVHDIELARILPDVDPRSYLPALEVGAGLGARAVLSSIWTTDRGLYIDKFGELCDLAKPLGMTVDLEPVPVAGVRTLAQALDAVPREWFHFAQICDATGEIPTDRERMTHIMRAERLYLGEGGIDVAGILRHIPPVPYSIELPHAARARELGYTEHAFRCLETARDYLSAHAQELELAS
jgi:sugar phosphate isomerase/epimerase